MTGRRSGKRPRADLWTPQERERLALAALSITAAPPLAPDEPLLPRVVEARQRDAEARQRLRLGTGSPEPVQRIDYAAALRKYVFRAARREKRR